MEITWYGHATVELQVGGQTLLIDPWLENDWSPVSPESVQAPDLVLVTHDHFDHLGDTVAILKHHPEARVVCVPETVDRLKEEEDVPDEQTVRMNIGGTITQGDEVMVTMTQAFHTSHSGVPVGYVVSEGSNTVYHPGDTGVFSDMSILNDLYDINLACLPVGGYFTMDPQQATLASSLLQPDGVIPIHYGSFPVLEPDASNFQERMHREQPGVRVTVPDLGESVSFSDATA